MAATDSLKGLRILVVEDQADSRYVLARLLTFAGATVLNADSAEAALALLTTTAVDIVVSDIEMPSHDGFWLVRELRTHAPNAPPVIAITGRVAPNDRRAILAAGFRAHLPKPADLDELIAAIRHVIGEHRHPPSA